MRLGTLDSWSLDEILDFELILECLTQRYSYSVDVLCTWEDNALLGGGQKWIVTG